MRVIGVGRLGQDPELKDVGKSQVCNFSVAVDDSYTDRDGNRQERTEWHNIVVWGKQAESCARFLSKGRQVFIEGKLQSRTYENKEGNNVKVWEVKADRVQFLGSKDEGASTSNGRSTGRRGRRSRQDEDEILF